VLATTARPELEVGRAVAGAGSPGPPVGDQAVDYQVLGTRADAFMSGGAFLAAAAGLVVATEGIGASGASFARSPTDSAVFIVVVAIGAVVSVHSRFPFS
jgi:hypothetical protein